MDKPLRLEMALILPAVLLLAWLYAGAFAQVSAAEGLSVHQSQRSVHFEVRDPERYQVFAGVSRLPLTVHLSRDQTDRDDVLLILEGTFSSQVLLPMATDPTSGGWQTTVVLDPALHPRTVNHPPGFRVDMSFAWMQGTKLIRFLSRSVYVTSGNDVTTCGADQPSHQDSGAGQTGSPPLGEARPTLPALSEEPVAETHLVGSEPPEGGAAYWWAIKHRITERWKRHHIRRGLDRHATTSPRVHVKLYANGIAQIVYLERSSGHAGVDDAAVKSVVESQPFPPFPSTLARCYLDVQVDIRAARPR